MTKALARSKDNIIQFQPQINLKLQRLKQINCELESESHLFIVILGTIIGAVLALFVGYHLNNSAVHFLLMITLPIYFAYMLRRVYIYTLIRTYL